MIKQPITYKDFDGNTVTENLWFHVSKTDLLDNMDLKPRFERLKAQLEGDKRQLSEPEVLSILAIVKDLMKLGYGVRSEDGKRFDNSPERWVEFKQTAAYDAYLWWLFEDPQRAMDFMVGMMPEDLVQQAQLQQETIKEPRTALGLPVESGPSLAEIQDMTPEQFQAWQASRR